MTHKSVTHVTGNTTTVTFRARSFQLTLNEILEYEHIVDYLTKCKPFRYLISCKEKAPTTGKEHIHIYVNYDSPKTLTTKKTGSAHIEKCRGSPKQNIDYIKKGGDIIEEIGEVPKQGSSMTAGELRKITNIDEIEWKMYNTWQKLQKHDEEIDVDDWGKEVKVTYISGPSGSGKTTKAKELIKESPHGPKFSRVKFYNGFWDGVASNRKIAVYDDFRDSHMSASEFINFVDYNRHKMNVKGGSCSNDYVEIIITSVIPLEEIYYGVSGEPREQWMRRIKEIALEERPIFSNGQSLNPGG